jgi:hypothetical protein
MLVPVPVPVSVGDGVMDVEGLGALSVPPVGAGSAVEGPVGA